MELLPIQSDSGCPSPDAVQAEVRELTTPAQRQAVPADASVVISDRGGSIAIAITRDGKTNVRVYEDAARDCDRRSHFVSVLVVVSLMPPDLGAPEPEPETASAPRRPATLPAPAQAAPPARETETETETGPEVATAPKRVRIELAARGAFSTPLSDSARVVSFGGALGVALGSGSTRLTLATGYWPKAKLEYTGAFAGRAEVERLDVAIGARWVVLRGPLSTSIDASAVGMRAEVGGQSTRRPSSDTAFSVGGRLGLHFGVAEERLFSPFLGASAAVFPFAPALSQLPQGTVGHLPYVWLGLTGGVSLAL